MLRRSAPFEAERRKQHFQVLPLLIPPPQSQQSDAHEPLELPPKRRLRELTQQLWRERRKDHASPTRKLITRMEKDGSLRIGAYSAVLAKLAINANPPFLRQTKPHKSECFFRGAAQAFHHATTH